MPTPPRGVERLLAGNERYEVGRRLGEGGMGTVYAGFDRRRQRHVALKFLRDPERGSLYRFKREFRATADLVHPNLVRLFDLGVLDDGSFFFTMELVEGSDLRRHAAAITSPTAAADGPTVPVALVEPHAARDGEPAAALAAVLAGVADGLAFLHRAGKVHRDLKPSNVMVGTDGRPRVLDFGILREVDRAAGLTRDSEAVGTPHYMAPEQVMGRDVGPPADLYALGCVLYEILTGRPPFDGVGSSVVWRHLQEQPVAPSSRRACDPELEELCLALLRKDPGDRPGAEEVSRGLWRRAGHPPPPAPAAPRVGPGLLGRDAELAALHDAFGGAAGGPCLVLIAGESGAGKSALAAELAERVQSGGGTTWLGRCWEREHVPYKALDAIVDEAALRLMRRGEDAFRLLPPGTSSLARLFPVLGEVPAVAHIDDDTPLRDAQADRRRAVRALFALIANLSGDTPPLLVIDDLQWADTDSIDVLTWLLRGGEPAPPCLVVATCRRDEVGADHPLRRLLDDGLRVEQLPLPPLGREALAELVRAWAPAPLGAAQCLRLAEESQGNPFLAVELARAAAVIGSEAPTVGELVRRRLAAASTPAHAVLEAAAVSGTGADFALLAAATGLAPAALAEAIDELLQTRLLGEVAGARGSEAFDFAHDRLRRAAVDAVPEERRRALHRTIALHLSAAGDAAGAVEHWQRAGELTQAREAARTAAQLAEQQLAFHRAAELYALAAAGGTPSAELEIARARALTRAGHHGEAARALERAAAIAPADAARELALDAAIEHIAAGAFADGMRQFDALLRTAGERLHKRPLVRMLAMSAYMPRIAAGWTVDDLTGRLFSPPSAPPDPATAFRLRLFEAINQHCAPFDPFMATEFGLKHAVLARRHGDVADLGRARIAHALRLLGISGASAERRALRHLHTGEALCAQCGDARGLLHAQMVRGFMHLLECNWIGGRAATERAEALARRHGLYGEAVLAHLHNCHIAAETFSGDPHAVLAVATTYLTDARARGNVIECVDPLLMTGLARLWLGDIDGGRAAIDEGLALVPAEPLSVLRLHAELYAVSLDLCEQKVDGGLARLDDLGRRCVGQQLLTSPFERALFDLQLRRLELLRRRQSGARRRGRTPSLGTLSRALPGGIPSTLIDESLRLDAAYALLDGKPRRALRRIEHALRLGEQRQNRIGLALALAARATLRARLAQPGADWDRQCARELFASMAVRRHYLLPVEGWDDPMIDERAAVERV
jgi:hypothetical protein